MDKRHLTPVSIVLAGLIISCAIIFAYGDNEETHSAPIDDMMSSGIVINSYNGGGAQINGTGFIVEYDKVYVVTAAQIVVAGGKPMDKIEGSVYGKDHKITHTLFLVSYDIGLNLAILEFEDTVTHPTSLKFGNSDDLRFGQDIYCVGNSGGGLAISKGGVADPTFSNNAIFPDRVLIRTDIGMSLDNKGGPIFDLEGNIVGMLTYKVLISTGAENISFAISSNDIERYVDTVLSDRS